MRISDWSSDVCSSDLIAGCTDPCVPFNLFGGAGSITQEMIDFVTFVQNDSSRQSTWDVTGNISGELFDLPGGPLGVAAGLQYRKLKGRFDPAPIVAADLSSAIPPQPPRHRHSVVKGKTGSVRVNPGGAGFIKKKK